MTPRPKTSALNVRITADEMIYLTGLSDELEMTLSDAVRTAISRSIMRDVEKGELHPGSPWHDLPAWVARTGRSITASPLEDDTSFGFEAVEDHDAPTSSS